MEDLEDMKVLDRISNVVTKYPENVESSFKGCIELIETLYSRFRLKFSLQEELINSIIVLSHPLSCIDSMIIGNN